MRRTVAIWSAAVGSLVLSGCAATSGSSSASAPASSPAALATSKGSPSPSANGPPTPVHAAITGSPQPHVVITGPPQPATPCGREFITQLAGFARNHDLTAAFLASVGPSKTTALPGGKQIFVKLPVSSSRLIGGSASNGDLTTLEWVADAANTTRAAAWIPPGTYLVLTDVPPGHAPRSGEYGYAPNENASFVVHGSQATQRCAASSWGPSSLPETSSEPVELTSLEASIHAALAGV
jgi:hypothetical protein